AQIERLAEGVRMRRFPPLAMNVLVAAGAVTRRQERAGWNEALVVRRRLAGQKGIAAEGQVVCRLCRLRMGLFAACRHADHGQNQHCGGACAASPTKTEKKAHHSGSRKVAAA